MAKAPTLSDVTNILTAATIINTNNDRVVTAFENTLSLDGSTPNAMEADLDLNSNDILNVGSLNVGVLIVGGVTQTPGDLVSTNAEIVLESVTAMKANADLVVGNRVRTLGYTTAYDGGGAAYSITTNVAFGTPDDLIDHQITGGLLVGELQHNRTFDAQQCGVKDGVESSTAFNNAFWRAAALAPSNGSDPALPVTFTCKIPVLTNKTLHLSREPASEFTTGARCVMDVVLSGTTATGGGTFETHLAAEMARLTTLHGSSVTLGSALAAQFLKADPQVAVFLGDKIERPLPLLNISLTRSEITLGDTNCDFWCSGKRTHRCSISRINGGKISNFRKYGTLVTKNTNNDIKTINETAKQWAIGDLEDHDGRMMAGGFLESRNMTGDSVVSCQKDMMWFGGNYGWGRTAVVTLDKCDTVEADRWAGRTMYPDYMTRWDDDMWDDHGGQINQPEWDYMTPSTGTGDCDFYGTHVMQGGAETGDEDAPFRDDGLDFGGQPGWENWNTTNPVNVYGADIDSSVTQCFGSGIRFYGPTITVGNTAKHAVFHPVVRFYTARASTFNFSVFKDWGGSIGFYPFDRGTAGVPDVKPLTGDFSAWNYRNRVDSDTILGDVQYRGQISGGTGNLPSADVTTIGDFFWVIEAGTYGGQAMALGDILYAKTLAPGTSYGANWYLGANNDVEALQSSRTVEIHKPVNTMIAHTTDHPVLWITKPDGDAAVRLETGLTELNMVFDGTKVEFDAPIVSSSPLTSGYGLGAGGAVEQLTSRTTAVTLDAPSGEITLFSAAGSATPTSFNVNCTPISTDDTVVVTQRTGTDLYLIYVTAVNANSFRITFEDRNGTTVEAPIFNYTIQRGGE